MGSWTCGVTIWDLGSLSQIVVRMQRITTFPGTAIRLPSFSGNIQSGPGNPDGSGNLLKVEGLLVFAKIALLVPLFQHLSDRSLCPRWLDILFLPLLPSVGACVVVWKLRR